MKKILLCCLLLGALLLGSCAVEQGATTPEGQLTMVTTTYPVYLLARAVADGVTQITVERLDTGATSCLHDYTLSVQDMKKIEGASVIAMNGLGLEDFMADALAASTAPVIDCSHGATLLESMGHDHDQEEDQHHWDPHIWLDPNNAVVMVDHLTQGLIAVDPAHQERYQANADRVIQQLQQWHTQAQAALRADGVGEIAGLITFHDGFQYFASAYDLPLLAAIEEEAGSEASAKEIVAITQLVQNYDLPMVFTERNGSDSTAKAIARETGCAVGELNMLMDGADGALSEYGDALLANVAAIVHGFSQGGGMTG